MSLSNDDVNMMSSSQNVELQSNYNTITEPNPPEGKLLLWWGVMVYLRTVTTAVTRTKKSK